MKMKIVALFLCLSQLVASEDVAATKDLNARNEVTNGLTSLFTLGLLGGGLALYSPNKRKDFVGSPEAVDRQGYYDGYYDYYPQQLSYAQRVKSVENRISGRLLGGLRGTLNNARKVSSRIRGAARRTGQRSLNVLRRAGGAMGRMASGTDRTLRGLARTANRGLRRITAKVSRTGHGSIERMGSSSANAGVAAIRGLYKVSRAYANGFEKATKNAYNGLSNVGKTYKRGFSRVGSNIAGLANAYSRGVKRMGQASSDNTGRLTDWVEPAVNRLGELASHGAATIGGLATQAGDAALAVPTAISDAALAVPKSLSTFSNDKKMRDCLLQAMCYISTPFIDPNSNYVKRSAEDDEVLMDLAQELNDGTPVRMEDCEAFKCEVVKYGKQAYEIVSKALEERRRK